MSSQKEAAKQNGYDENGRLFSEFDAPSYEEWKEAAVKLLKGKPFDKVMNTKTYEGITLKPIYFKEDLEELPHVGSLPGYAPYVRGTKVEGYLGKPWDISQEINVSLPKELNEILLHDLMRGQTGLNIVLDKPSRRGLDADVENAEAVGVKGVSVSTLKDVEELLNDVVLDVIPLYINAGANAMPAISLLAAHVKKDGKDSSVLHGCVGADPLGELAKEGSISLSLEKAYDLMAKSTSWAVENTRDLRTILVEGHTYHNGGADAVSEVAYAVATGVEYIREMTNRGIDVSDVSRRMAFSFSLGSEFFMQVAKIRAARMVWAQIVEEFGGDAEAQKMYIHARTSSWTKTVYDPYVNMLRDASEAFSGAIAGVDSMHVTPFDEPVRESDEFSRRIARNVQSILQDECHFTQPVDPAGGSWYIESLTHEVAKKVWELFQNIEAAGGMSSELKAGNIQKAVEAKAEEKFTAMAIRRHKWVGTNMYPNLTEEPLEARNIDYKEISSIRAEAVQEYKQNRDDAKVAGTLKTIECMECAIEAVSAGATIGEVATAANTGKPESVNPVREHRGAERYEELRKNAERIKAEKGSMKKVFLINMGPIPQHKARADFTTGFFEVGGFEVIKNNGFATIDEAVEATLASGAEVGVICSTDATYPELVPAIAKKIKAAKPEMEVILAGKPAKDLDPVYREAGMDDCIHVRANCYEILKRLQEGGNSNA